MRTQRKKSIQQNKRPATHFAKVSHDSLVAGTIGMVFGEDVKVKGINVVVNGLVIQKQFSQQAQVLTIELHMTLKSTAEKLAESSLTLCSVLSTS